MQYSFTLQCPECFSEAHQNGSELAAHRRLLNGWKNYFTLFAGDREGLKKLISCMPKRFQDLWVEAIKHEFPIRYSDGVDLENDSKNNYAHFLTIHGVSIFIIHPNHRRKYNLKVDDIEKIIKGITLSPVDCFDQTHFFSNVRENHERDIRAGLNTDDVFQSRIRPIVDCAIRIAIVDRYLVTQTIRSVNMNEISGIERVLRGIADQPSLRKVSIYVAKSEEVAERDPESRFVGEIDRLKKKYIPKVALSVFISADHYFGRHCHGRFIRSGARVINLDVGLEVLSGEKVRRICHSSVTSNGKEKLSQEKKLEDGSVPYVR